MAVFITFTLTSGYILQHGDSIFNSLGYNQGGTLYCGAANGIVDLSLDRLDVTLTVQAGLQRQQRRRLRFGRPGRWHHAAALLIR